MNKQEFLNELSKYGKGKFELLDEKVIRSKEETWCPLGFVHSIKYNNTSYDPTISSIADQFNMDYELANRIAYCADNTVDDLRLPSLVHLRNELLTACGLEERQVV